MPLGSSLDALQTCKYAFNGSFHTNVHWLICLGIVIQTLQGHRTAEGKGMSILIRLCNEKQHRTLKKEE